jgi:hypothetical protein
MLAKRLSRGGGAIISALTVYLAWAQVANHLAKWSIVIGGLPFIVCMMARAQRPRGEGPADYHWTRGPYGP